MQTSGNAKGLGMDDTTGPNTSERRRGKERRLGQRRRQSPHPDTTQPLNNASGDPLIDEDRRIDEAAAAAMAANNDDALPPVDRWKQIRRTFTQLGPWRLALTLGFLVLAVCIARFSTDWPLLAEAERGLYDLRATVSAPHVPQDQRITMVTYTDEVLIQTRVRSPLDRQLLANALAVLDKMGAKSIGIDILIDQPTDADDALRTQLRAMQTPTFLAFAEPTTNPNDIQKVQADFLAEFVRSVSGGQTHPASIRLATDSDDTYRRWPGRAPGTPQLLAVAMAAQGTAFEHYLGSVRWRLPAQVTTGEGVDQAPVFDKIPITTFTDPALASPENLPMLAELVRGRHLLIGGDITGIDEFATPISRLPDLATGEAKKMIGLEVHANMLAQILDHAALRPIASWALWGTALAAVLMGAATALLNVSAWRAGLLFLLQMAAIAVVPVMLHNTGIDTLHLPVFGLALGWLLAYIAASAALRAVGAEERAFAQSALGKYLPRDIARQILRDPDQLALHGEKRPIFCLFSDLEGFTEMSHQLTPEQVAFVLNGYLDTLSDVVLAYGGTIDKFVGDAVVAFWGAPIARPDDAQNATAALAAMADAGDRFSLRMARELGGSLPPIGRTRVGLHYGEAVVGNFGGEGRIQYTALGDSMNTASRLEAANKAMKTRALISAEALADANSDLYVPMGRIRLRGRAQPVEVFEPRGDLPAETRDTIRAMVAAHEAGDQPRYSKLRETIQTTEIDRRGGIDFLIERLDTTAAGGFYVLS